jgi:hypothetical protein
MSSPLGRKFRRLPDDVAAKWSGTEDPPALKRLKALARKMDQEQIRAAHLSELDSFEREFSRLRQLMSMNLLLAVVSVFSFVLGGVASITIGGPKKLLAALPLLALFVYRAIVDQRAAMAVRKLAEAADQNAAKAELLMMEALAEIAHIDGGTPPIKVVDPPGEAEAETQKGRVA